MLPGGGGSTVVFVTACEGSGVYVARGIRRCVEVNHDANLYDYRSLYMIKTCNDQGTSLHLLTS
jgi:hypothetical protein